LDVETVDVWSTTVEPLVMKTNSKRKSVYKPDAFASVVGIINVPVTILVTAMNSFIHGSM
jgi:hypothetical protein